jgi:hypothetical protein
VDPTAEQLRMIDEFQCPGCMCGLNTGDCDQFKFSLIEHPEWPRGPGFRCVVHVPGTSLVGVVSDLVYLGMPIGFNRVGLRFIRDHKSGGDENSSSRIRIFLAPARPEWDVFNVPVWAMVKDDHLFVRTMSPRINFTWIDVVKGGTLSMCPQAIDVGGLEMD